MERIVNVINERGEREERLLFAVSVARNNDRSGVHYNYMDGDGHLPPPLGGRRRFFILSLPSVYCAPPA